MSGLAAHLEGDIIDGPSAFHLYDTFGFPIEFTEELARENTIKVDIEGFNESFREHQEKSSAGAEQRFKGGLCRRIRTDNAASYGYAPAACGAAQSAWRRGRAKGAAI